VKVFFDTNIIIDIIAKRPGYMEARELFTYCETRRLTGFMSAVTVTDVMYILRKDNDCGIVRIALQTMMQILKVTVVKKSDLAFAFASAMPDFEDAVQASCAKRSRAKYIITRNTKDFANSPIPALTPTDFLKL
jgi:predicted nucleic acid-binding protein